MNRTKLRIISALICVLAAFSSFAGCKKEPPKEQTIIPEGYTALNIGESNGVKTEGYGVQWDTHIYKAYNSMSEAEMAEFYKRVEDMNVQTIRTQVFPEWFERGNDNDDYNVFDYESSSVDMNSIEMTQLYTLLDYCEKHGITVDLSFYGCCAIYESQDGKIIGSWLGAPYTKNWITSPKLKDEKGNDFPGLDEYAENVWALLNYLLNVKKYTCVTEFSVYPEPNLSYVTADGCVDHAEYVSLIKKIDARLKKEGIRGRIVFSGPATALQSVMGLNIYINDLNDVFDKYTISSYSYDDKDSNSTLYDYGDALSGLISDTGKTFSLAEFGSKNVEDSANQTDIDTYQRALFIARYMINLTNAGCAGMKYWEVCDMMYGSFMMNLGLWKFRKDNFVARPQYYTWSLIMKYTDIGSEVYPITTDVSGNTDLVAVAFKLPDGKWTYVACNTGSSTQKISFVNEKDGKPSKMNVYEVRASKCDGTCSPIEASSEITRENNTISLKVFANSFVVLSER